MGLPVVVVALHLPAGTRYFSDGGYTTQPADIPASASFEARLIGKITWSREANVYVWGERRRSGGIGDVELINTDGALDARALDASAKGVLLEVLTGTNDQAFAAFLIESAVTVNEVSAKGETSIKISTLGLLSRLDMPLPMPAYATGAVDATVVGKLRPISIGEPLSVPGVLVDTVDYEYDVHDTCAFEKIVKVRDGGFLLTEGVGWQRAVNVDRWGFERLALPTSRVVADVWGHAIKVADVITPSVGDFDSGLTGWTVFGTTATASGGGCVLSGSAVESVFIQVSGLTAGKWHRWSIATVTVTSGQLEILAGGVLIATVTTSGAKSGYFFASGGGAFRIRDSIAVPSAFNIFIDGVRCEELGHIRYLPEILAHLVVDRGGMTAGDIDAASVTALDAAAHWPISYWADGTVNLRDVIDDVLDSYCAAAFENHLGKIEVAQLTAPALLTPVATISDSVMVAGTELQISIDAAPGLSKTVAGQRNWYRYNESEILDGVSDADRALLITDYRVRATAAATVSAEVAPTAGQGQRPRLSPSIGPIVPGVSRPASESGFGTLLDVQADCLSHANHAAALYPDGGAPRFITVQCWAAAAALRTLDPLQAVLIESARFGLTPAVPAVVKSVSGAYGDQQISVVLWLVQ